MYKYPVEDPTLHRCIAIAISQKRFIRSELKRKLTEKCIYIDLQQELATAGVEAWRMGMNPDTEFRQIKNLTQRKLYAFLKAYGFTREWDPMTKKLLSGYSSREYSLNQIQERKM